MSEVRCHLVAPTEPHCGMSEFAADAVALDWVEIRNCDASQGDADIVATFGNCGESGETAQRKGARPEGTGNSSTDASSQPVQAIPTRMSAASTSLYVCDGAGAAPGTSKPRSSA